MKTFSIEDKSGWMLGPSAQFIFLYFAWTNKTWVTHFTAKKELTAILDGYRTVNLRGMERLWRIFSSRIKSEQVWCFVLVFIIYRFVFAFVRARFFGGIHLWRDTFGFCFRDLFLAVFFADSLFFKYLFC